MRRTYMGLSLPALILVIACAPLFAAEEVEHRHSASAVFEEALAERGLDAALAELREVMADTSGAYEVEPHDLVLALPDRLSRRGRRAEAISLLEFLEDYFGEHSRYWLELGNAYIMSGDRQKAEMALGKVLEAEPKRADIAFRLENLDEMIRVARIQSELENKYAPGENTGIKGPYLGQEPPGRRMEVFSPGILSSTGHDYSITFTPDGREIYFSRGGIGIMVCRWEEEGWTAPEPVTFIEGHEYSDEPNISPDGKHIFFCSRVTMRDLREVYVADREGNGWGEPRHLFRGMYATSSLDGNLYYTLGLDPEEPANSDIVMRRPADGTYSGPTVLAGGVNSDTQEAHPFIAPDESYIIFDTVRGEFAGLSICYRNEDGTWSDAVHFRDVLGTPPAGQAAVSPDGKYVFFCLAGDMYWMSADFIEELRPD